MDRFVVISGCSGGGKSTLLAELARRGHAVLAEPGRRIVESELEGGGTALPWVDMAAFARRAVEMALMDRERAVSLPGTVFFDRGLIDAAVALEHATGRGADELCRDHRYNRIVFFTPPWPEIFHADDARRHDLAEAAAEYERLGRAYAAMGYVVEILPKVAVAARADLIAERLALS